MLANVVDFCRLLWTCGGICFNCSSWLIGSSKDQSCFSSMPLCQRRRRSRSMRSTPTSTWRTVRPADRLHTQRAQKLKCFRVPICLQGGAEGEDEEEEDVPEERCLCACLAVYCFSRPYMQRQPFHPTPTHSPGCPQAPSSLRSLESKMCSQPFGLRSLSSLPAPVLLCFGPLHLAYLAKPFALVAARTWRIWSQKSSRSASSRLPSPPTHLEGMPVNLLTMVCALCSCKGPVPCMNSPAGLASVLAVALLLATLRIRAAYQMALGTLLAEALADGCCSSLRAQSQELHSPLSRPKSIPKAQMFSYDSST